VGRVPAGIGVGRQHAGIELVRVDYEDYDVNVADIQDRWPEVRVRRKAPESTTVENEQLRRMLDSWEILEDNRQQLEDQLPLIYHA